MSLMTLFSVLSGRNQRTVEDLCSTVNEGNDASTDIFDKLWDELAAVTTKKASSIKDHILKAFRKGSFCSQLELAA